MAISYSAVSNPKYANAEGTRIEATVVFDHLVGSYPNGVVFCAAPDDCEPHGREIFSRCVAGDFGLVAEYTPPSENEQAAYVRLQRNALLVQTDWTQLPDVPEETKARWAPYRQQLRDVTLQEGFPYNVIWPTEPV